MRAASYMLCKLLCHTAYITGFTLLRYLIYDLPECARNEETSDKAQPSTNFFKNIFSISE